MDWREKHNVHHLSKEDLDLIKTYFDKLDANNDGKISLNDIIATLENDELVLKDHDAVSEAKALLKKMAPHSDHKGQVTFHEFVDFFLKQDRQLSIAFEKIDNDGSGVIDKHDVQAAFEKQGIPIDHGEAMRLVQCIDKDKDAKIDYHAWREFLLFRNAHNLREIMEFWRTASYMEPGDNVSIPEDVRDTKKALLTTACAAFAAVVSRTATAPFDRIRVMRQVYGYKHQNSHIWKVTKYMIQEGGIVSMWRGNGINLLKITPECAIKFSVYRVLRGCLHADEGEEKSHLSTFLAGSIAGATAQTVIYPLEVVKTRMCLRKSGQYTSVFHCVRSMMSEGRIKTFYRGYLPNICGAIPCAGIELGLYDTLRNLLRARYFPEATEPPPIFAVPLIMFSISVAMVVTYPLVLVRTKLQSKAVFAHAEHNTMRGLLQTIYRREGVSGLYRGLGASFLKVLPAYAINYYMFETLNKKFQLKTFQSKND